MAQYQAVEVQRVAATTSSGSTPVTFEGGIQALYISCDTDCYINFETPSTSGNGFLIKGATQASQFLWPAGNITKIYLVAASGTSNVSLLGVRGAT